MGLHDWSVQSGHPGWPEDQIRRLWTPARRGWACRHIQRRESVRPMTRPDICMWVAWMSLLCQPSVPLRCVLLQDPRSWCLILWRHTASSGWGWSTGSWWCHRPPMCTDACPHSDPTAWLGRPFLLMHRVSRQVRRWHSSGSRCGPCGWSSACSWSDSIPWQPCPSQQTQWLG